MLPVLLACALLAAALGQTTVATTTPAPSCDCSGCCQLLPLWIVLGVLGGIGLGVLGAWIYIRCRPQPKHDSGTEPLLPPAASGTVVYPGRIVVPMSRGMRSG